MITDKHINILAIETSCDETAAAVVCDGRLIKSNIISTQIPDHTLYGGVVPEIASRKHVERIDRVIKMALEEADTDLFSLDAIACTYGPGLVGALLVGVSEAKALAWASNLPLVGVHHIEGHIAANYIEDPSLVPPFLCLVVSGGHTHLVQVKDYGRFEILGKTVDDAAGEAFDKVARSIGLGYPGGPKIEEAAKRGDANAIHFPRAKVDGSPYDFSFSGLKSAVLNYINQEKMKGESIIPENIAAGFQDAVVGVLADHAGMAMDEFGAKDFCLAGGVASNGALRAAIKESCEKRGVRFHCPSSILCTDNAAMIGSAAYYEYISGQRSGWELNAIPGLKLGARA